MLNTENHILLTTSALTEVIVRNIEGGKLGKIKDMVVDTTTGQIIYAVLAVDAGFLGRQNKFFAIPWKAFQFNENQENAVLLDITREKLENSPGIDMNDWPAAPQKEFINEVFRHYGYDPYYFITE